MSLWLAETGNGPMELRPMLAAGLFRDRKNSKEHEEHEPEGLTDPKV